MEDGLNGSLTESTVSEHTQNGVNTIMANFPEGVATENKEDNSQAITICKVNGSVDISNEEDNSSETDALVIDESIPKHKRTKKRKRAIKNKSAGLVADDNTVVTHSNPYFNESLFELSQQHQDFRSDSVDKPLTKSNCRIHRHKRIKTKNNPKLREYAQYLGLQPAVQFKCSKCQQAGFESLTTLNEHMIHCIADPSVQLETRDNSTSSFKLTRKVFLCSACGTYYENWNLYMHMLEFHRRFICLYCLGMFSVLDDLCQHIQTRHNCEPGYRNSPDEFFNVYSDPCYIICCECKNLFSEQDNFFYHICVQSEVSSTAIKNSNSSKISAKSKVIKQLIRPENHITGDSTSVHQKLDNSSLKESVETEFDISISNSNNFTSPIETTNLTENTMPCDSFLNSTQCVDVPKNFEKQLILVNDPIPMETCSESELSNLTVDARSQEVVDSEESVDQFKEKEGDEKDYLHTESNSNLSDMNPCEQTCQTDTDESNLFLYKNQETMTKVDETQITEENCEPIETRKVPKLSLKLPKSCSFLSSDQEDSDNDSDRLSPEVAQIESENESLHCNNDMQENMFTEPQMQIAGSDINITELQLEQPLDKFDIRILLQKCLSATSSICIYCNHARKIAVNGKQLGLHAIAEHRYSAIVNSITEEELIPESFVDRIRESLDNLENIFFNLDSNLSDEAVTFSHLFECFQCRYTTGIHKELYLHNRKLHTKNLLLCIMCKSNFYSYSELICHLCPGVYVLDFDVQFRCCMCVSDDLPSAFRLMVHLRKRHNVCDVCLEMCHNQYKLSNHVWKHKLHHFCYRCGIAYRNKLDITRHLFWKHGTESVLCKKCLQKKWPHVFHFCVPPPLFTCEECSLTFTKAVYLKVHKRIHSNDKPHHCTLDDCCEKFISKKLLAKHEVCHREPPEEPKPVQTTSDTENQNADVQESLQINKEDSSIEEKSEEKPKAKIDVYDLPELNLSESDSSDSEGETSKPNNENIVQEQDNSMLLKSPEIINNDVAKDVFEENLDNSIKIEIDPIEKKILHSDNEEKSTLIIDNIWDDFKMYQANKEKMDNMFVETEKIEEPENEIQLPVQPKTLTCELALRDHDYFYNPENKQDTSMTEVKPDLSQRVDHDYCTPKEQTFSSPVHTTEGIHISPKKRTISTSSNSSTNSNSSSCSCGSNCSCSSSSGSSSSSSDSSDSDSSTEEGRKKQQVKRERKRQKQNNQKGSENIEVSAPDKGPALEIPILESDLDTSESETDEEFYDKQPQKLAKKLLEEKRNQLLAEMGTLPNGSFIENSRNSTPSLPEEIKPKKKSKSKKRKKKKSERKESLKEYNISKHSQTRYTFYQSPVVAPLTISLNRNSPVLIHNSSVIPNMYPKVVDTTMSKQEADMNLRASKRRRVPNKFYGYSSDEDGEKISPNLPAKWRKTEQQFLSQPQPPLLVPPITIKAILPSIQQTVEPITIRPTARPGELRVHQRPSPVPLQPAPPNHAQHEKESATDSNDSSAEEVPVVQKDKQVQLYCYCRCPYDEVSEMIGCDSHDCEIEWFHFECVGIMVPPKGQWFCPDCRKRKQQRRELP